jgi:hypothetical protein
MSIKQRVERLEANEAIVSGKAVLALCRTALNAIALRTTGKRYSQGLTEAETKVIWEALEVEFLDKLSPIQMQALSEELRREEREFERTFGSGEAAKAELAAMKADIAKQQKPRNATENQEGK